MSIELSINTLIVPEEVTRENLKGYSDAELLKIEEVYQKIKAEQIAKFTGEPAERAPFNIIAGSRAAGKSNLIKGEFSELPVCDADDFIKALIAQDDDIRLQGMSLQASFHNNHDVTDIRMDLKNLTKKYEAAGHYGRNRLASELTGAGIPLVMTITGDGKNIGKFYDAVEKVANPNIIICDATVEAKMESSQDPIYGIAVSKDDIKEEHDKVRNNMLALVSLSSSPTIYFRDAANKPLEVSSLRTIVRDNERQEKLHAARPAAAAELTVVADRPEAKVA